MKFLNFNQLKHSSLWLSFIVFHLLSRLKCYIVNYLLVRYLDCVQCTTHIGKLPLQRHKTPMVCMGVAHFVRFSPEGWIYYVMRIWNEMRISPRTKPVSTWVRCMISMAMCNNHWTRPTEISFIPHYFYQFHATMNNIFYHKLFVKNSIQSKLAEIRKQTEN